MLTVNKLTSNSQTHTPAPGVASYLTANVQQNILAVLCFLLWFCFVLGGFLAAKILLWTAMLKCYQRKHNLRPLQVRYNHLCFALSSRLCYSHLTMLFVVLSFPNHIQRQKAHVKDKGYHLHAHSLNLAVRDTWHLCSLPSKVEINVFICLFFKR